MSHIIIEAFCVSFKLDIEGVATYFLNYYISFQLTLIKHRRKFFHILQDIILNSILDMKIYSI